MKKVNIFCNLIFWCASYEEFSYLLDLAGNILSYEERRDFYIFCVSAFHRTLPRESSLYDK